MRPGLAVGVCFTVCFFSRLQESLLEWLANNYKKVGCTANAISRHNRACCLYSNKAMRRMLNTPEQAFCCACSLGASWSL